MKSTADGSQPTVPEKARLPKPSEWLWRPWYAKLWWALTLLYWLGLEGLMLVPADHPIFRWFALIEFGVLIFNPLTVLVVLGRSYMRAKVARGDWEVTPGATPSFMERLRRERMAAEINPADARSGWMHREYLNRSKPRHH